ncbi:hypothetical protein PSP6_520006 [Paraburkholderia tropica]|nr:hypothetical protein PSP6_520006 [Paraburkholderia tropica]
MAAPISSRILRARTQAAPAPEPPHASTEFVSQNAPQSRGVFVLGRGLGGRREVARLLLRHPASFLREHSIGKISSDGSRRPAGHRVRLEFDGCQLTTMLTIHTLGLSMRRSHAKKEVEAALVYAETQGWLVMPGKGNGHAWGRMFCPLNQADCRCGEFCITSIWSTPRNAGNHANMLKRVVDNCTAQRVKAPVKAPVGGAAGSVAESAASRVAGSARHQGRSERPVGPHRQE